MLIRRMIIKFYELCLNMDLNWLTFCLILDQKLLQILIIAFLSIDTTVLTSISFPISLSKFINDVVLFGHQSF